MLTNSEHPVLNTATSNVTPIDLTNDEPFRSAENTFSILLHVHFVGKNVLGTENNSERPLNAAGIIHIIGKIISIATNTAKIVKRTRDTFFLIFAREALIRLILHFVRFDHFESDQIDRNNNHHDK